MKSRSSAGGPQIALMSSAVSRVVWFTTVAEAMTRARLRKSFAVTWKPSALSVYDTTPLPANASSAVPAGSFANTSTRSGTSRYFEPM
jgi:hypothetical protein